MSPKKLILSALTILASFSSTKALEVQVFWRGSALASDGVGEVPLGSSVSTSPAPQALNSSPEVTYNAGTYTIAPSGYIQFIFAVNTAFDLPNFNIYTTAVSQSTSFQLWQDDPSPTAGTLMASRAGLLVGNNVISFTPVTFSAQDHSIFLYNSSSNNLTFTTPTNFTAVFTVPEASTKALAVLCCIAASGLMRRPKPAPLS